jgi:hypothetical protein
MWNLDKLFLSQFLDILNKDNNEENKIINNNKNKEYKFVEPIPKNYYDNYLSNIYELLYMPGRIL